MSSSTTPPRSRGAPRGSDRSSGLINNLGLAPTNPTQKVKLEMARKLIADEQDAAASPRARSPKGTRSPKARDRGQPKSQLEQQEMRRAEREAAKNPPAVEKAAAAAKAETDAYMKAADEEEQRIKKVKAEKQRIREQRAATPSPTNEEEPLARATTPPRRAKPGPKTKGKQAKDDAEVATLLEPAEDDAAPEPDAKGNSPLQTKANSPEVIDEDKKTTEEEVNELFGQFDSTGDGYLDVDETIAMMKELGLNPGEEFYATFSFFDLDGSGEIDKGEFLGLYKFMEAQSHNQFQVLYYAKVLHNQDDTRVTSKAFLRPLYYGEILAVVAEEDDWRAGYRILNPSKQGWFSSYYVSKLPAGRSKWRRMTLNKSPKPKAEDAPPPKTAEPDLE